MGIRVFSWESVEVHGQLMFENEGEEVGKQKRKWEVMGTSRKINKSNKKTPNLERPTKRVDRV
jgi:hypothetical protein